MSSTALLTNLNPPTAAFYIEEIGLVSIEGSKINEYIEIQHDSIGIRRNDHETVKFWRYIRGVRDLKALRAEIHEIVNLPRDSTVNPLKSFLERCDSIFALIQKAVEISKEAPKTTIRTAKYLRWLKDQLFEIEKEFGEGSVVKVEDNTSKVTLCYKDSGNRQHIVVVDTQNTALSFQRYFRVSMDPSPLKRRRLNDEELDLVTGYRNFRKRIEGYQDFYSTVAQIDTECRVKEEGDSHEHNQWLKRSIKIEGENYITLQLDPDRLKSLPSLTFEGPLCYSFEEKFDREKWDENRSVKANIESCLGMTIPAPRMRDTTNPDECMICFGDGKFDEDESADGEMTACENSACSRKFHSSCLRNWLVSLHTSRISFDRIIGECPYCKNPTSVEMEEF